MLPLFLLIIFLISLSTIETIDHNSHGDFFTCLQSFKNSKGDVYTPTNKTYSTILQSSIQNLRVPTILSLKPTAILRPVDASQIQAAIYCSKKYGLQIRVRSGGHDYEGLSYTSQVPFLIIDLRNLRAISVDSKNKAAWVEAGAILGELYHAIAKKSRTLAFPAGACPTVGVGGHFSGGGFSMISRKFGISADNIINAKIIDYQGGIMDRKSMGNDLFWAIRGGGGISFGIIISWKLRLVTVPETVTVFNVSRTIENHAIALLHRWQYIAPKTDENLLIRVFINSLARNSTLPGNRTIQVLFKSMYIGGRDDLLITMQKEFPELGLEKTDCTEMSWIESALYFGSIPRGKSIDALLSRTPYGVYFKGKSDFVVHPISENGLKGILQRLQESHISAQLQFTPYGGKMAEISESKLPFPHRAGNLFMIHYGVGWQKDQNVKAHKYITWIRKFYKYMSAHVSKSPRRAYLNYRDLDLGVYKSLSNSTSSYRQARKWGRKYFSNNFERLVHVKSKVDPSNFFRNEQSVPPFSYGVTFFERISGDDSIRTLLHDLNFSYTTCLFCA